jgi:hypothetical protein
VVIMTRVLRLAAVAGGQRQVVEIRPLRRWLRAALFRAALLAVRLAARLEAADGRTRDKTARVAAPHPYARSGAAGIWMIEAVVYLGVAALFVAGLVGVFIA